MAESSRDQASPPSLRTAVLLAAMLVHVLAKWPIVTHDHGIYWPDEIYESLEMAHRAVFGYGLVPWEFMDGARNWAVPLVFTLPMRATVALGGDAPEHYLLATRLCLTGLTLLVAWWIARGAREQGAGDLAAALAAGGFLICATTLYFSHRALSENLAQLPTIAGVVLLARVVTRAPLDRAARRRAIVLGASALGFATLLRLQVGLVCVTSVGWFAVRASRQPAARRDLYALLVTLTAWALIYGALDAWSYGRLPDVRWYGWFHSAIAYWRFNAVESGARFWGTAPFYYYALVLVRALDGLASVLALGTVLSLRRLPYLATVIVVFLGVHSLIPHKELRFILPVVPLIFMAAAIGLSTLTVAAWRRAGLAALAATALLSFVEHRSLAMRDIGAYPERRTDPAFDDFGAVNRLMLIARTQPDLCGLRVEAPLSWTGGSTYLHRRVPIYGTGMTVPPTAANFAIDRTTSQVPSGRPPVTAAIAVDGRYALRRLSSAPCVADQAYDWTLR